MSVLISDSANPSYGTSVETVTITNGGTGYTISDSLTLIGGNSGCTVSISGVNINGTITGVTVTATGSGYALSGYTTTGGTGSDAQISVSSLYNGFSTTNGFYRVESSNMGLFGTNNIGISTGQHINITFANACNCLGVVLPILGLTANGSRGVNIGLEEYQSITSFDTGTEKINKVGHGLNNDDKVSFSTTGVLPTGIASGTQYYVVNRTANDFQISLTISGSTIGLSGTPSGTWAVGVEKASKLLTVAEISGDDSYHRTVGVTLYNTYGTYITAARFDSPYAVTTTAGLYRIRVMTGSGAAGAWSVKSSDGGVSMAYAVWGDNQVSYTNDDIVIVKDELIVDRSLSLGGVLGTLETTCATSVWLCANTTDPTPDNVALLKWQNPPISSYTLTVKGRIFLSTLSGIRVGTSTLRIPYAQKAIITFTTPMSGTLAPGIGTVPLTSVASTGLGGGSMFFYGEIPTYQKTNLISDAAVTQNHLLCTDNVDWVNGDLVVMGKANVLGQGQTGIWTVSGVSGNDITLTTNLTSYTQRAGGTVVRLNYHGILIQNDVSVSLAQLACPANFQFSGVDIFNVQFPMYPQISYYYIAAILIPSLRSQWLIQDCVLRTTSASTAFFISVSIPPEGILIQRVYTHRMAIANTIASYFTALISAGRLTIRDSATLCQYSNGIIPTSNSRVSIFDNSFENSRSSTNTYFVVFQGIECEFYNNTFFGNGSSSSNFGTVYVAQCVNPIKIENNYYDSNACAMGFGAFATINCSDKNSTFGREYINTTDIYLGTGCIPDYIFRNLIEPSSGLVIDTSSIEDMVVGSKIAFTNYGGITNNDWTLQTLGRTQRTGYGLTGDTTVHTSGTDKYALRLESTSTAGDIEFSQKVPTGNIQGLTASVSAWIKINSTAFYGGNHTNPTMSIIYDDNTIISTGSTDTTDWQLLTLTFVPTTTSTEFELIIYGSTDATSTDAYFYVDDITVSYPIGASLDLGGLDIWADGLPITPSINARISARSMVTTDGNVLMILNPQLGSDSQLMEI